MYDGYAWLTNAIKTQRVRYRLLLMGGMGSSLLSPSRLRTHSADEASRSASPT
jgi:hypothetical protein